MQNVALFTAVIPFVTALLKKLLGTEKMTYGKGINALLPVLLGVLSSGLVSYESGESVLTSLAIGLGSGGVASSARDIEKNLLGIVNSVVKLIKK